MSRIEAKGKGILLLHDIQRRTVEALPRILHDLKARGYRIVHVVSASSEMPKTPTQPEQWRLHPESAVASVHWPAVPGFAFARSDTLPVPALADLGLRDGALLLFPQSFNEVKRLARGKPTAQDAFWPKLAPGQGPAAALPAPDAGLFVLPSKNKTEAAPETGTLVAMRAIPGSAPMVPSRLRAAAP